ncbi:MAG: hypothetical protein MI723_09365 [Caulobacterales bacterium]|nr:hypothetical protein [Caulobacterales bacterium]
MDFEPSAESGPTPPPGRPQPLPRLPPPLANPFRRARGLARRGTGSELRERRLGDKQHAERYRSTAIQRSSRRTAMAGSGGRKTSDYAMLPSTPHLSELTVKSRLQAQIHGYTGAAPLASPRPAPKAASLSVSRRLMFILKTIAMTARSSLGVSFVLAIGFSLIALLLAPILLDRASVWRAMTGLTLQPMAGLWPQAAFVALAIGFGVEAVRSMAGYVWRRREWTLKKLRALLPSAQVLQTADVSSLKLYVTGLRTAAFTAYVCETAVQFVAIGIVIWGVESATPNFHLFTQPDAVTPWAAVLFLAQAALDNFGLKEVLRISWTSLTATDAFPFSLAIWAFQVYLVGVLAREIWSSWRIKPEDISKDLHDALNR